MCLKSSDSMMDLLLQEEKSKQIDLELKRDGMKLKNTVRVLLLGPAESGKSTFVKQMKILHRNGFSIEEKRKAIETIYDNVHESIFTLVINLRKHCIQLEQQMSITSVDYILSMGPRRPDIIPTIYLTHIKMLWFDDGIRKLYENRNTFQLLDCAKYFLDKIDEIYVPSYIPTDSDILQARTVTNGVHEMEFSVKKGNNSYNILLIDVGGQRDERSKWVQAFDGIKVVLYLAACSEFDQQLCENETQNRLKESLKVFRTVWHSRYLRNAGIIVFLNKTDMLEAKLRKGKRIDPYFDEFVQFQNTYNCKSGRRKMIDPCDIEKTKAFINHMFTQIAVPFTIRGFIKDEEILVLRDCTLHFTTATNTENIKKVFADCQHIILINNLKKWNID